MRARLAALLLPALVGCGGAAPPEEDCVVDGRTYPAGSMFSLDGCNTCRCMDGEAQCTLIFCPPADAGVAACAPAGACTTGVPCGAGCCAAGERCLGDRCVCGEAGLLCGEGDTCATAGPVGPGEAACGVTCCGASGPCPL